MPVVPARAARERAVPLYGRPTRHAGRAFARARRCLIVSATCLAAGCSRNPHAASASSTAAAPTETLTQLIAHHDARRYERMYPLIVPEQREDAVKYVRAMDELLDANRMLAGFVRTHIGAGVLRSIDQSHLARNMNIFSHDVKLLDEVVDGDRATVGFTVEDALPARRAALRRVEGAWLYDPGQGDSGRIVPAVRRMAEGLRATLHELQNGKLDPAEMRRDPAQLVEAVRVRLAPGIRMLPEAPGPGG